MIIKKHIVRILRNILYRQYTKAEKRFRKINRSFLRLVSSSPGPGINTAVITDRNNSDQWETLQPVWVLSTGRTGTNTLTELLKLSPALDVYHEPAPELFRFSFDYYQGKLNRAEALKAMTYLRDERVFRSFRDGCVYIETNNRVSYIADLLLELYPASRFIYIYRNPYDFIRSGMRRHYYNGHLRDSARITPRTSDPYFSKWSSFTDIEKVAWNWKTVNEHCLTFLDDLKENKKMSLSSENFFNAPLSVIQSLFIFTGSEFYHPPVPDIRRVMGRKYNAQTEGSFNKPEEWTDELVERVDRIIDPVARRLSYSLFTPGKYPAKSTT